MTAQRAHHWFAGIGGGPGTPGNSRLARTTCARPCYCALPQSAAHHQKALVRGSRFWRSFSESRLRTRKNRRENAVQVVDTIDIRPPPRNPNTPTPRTTPRNPSSRLPAPAFVAQLVAREAENAKVLGSILDFDRFLGSILTFDRLLPKKSYNPDPPPEIPIVDPC